MNQRVASGLFLIVALFCAPPVGLADTEVVVITEIYDEPPGKQRWMLGELYRDLWSTPVELEVLNLDVVGGGLEPVMRVGGHQTKGLALKGCGDGKSYTFRGVFKSTKDITPPEFVDSGIELIMQDMMSAALPGSDVLLPPLSDALGVLHVDASLVVMPDDPILGEFQEDFAGVVGTFMEFPTDGFAGSSEVLSAKEFLEVRRASVEGLPDTRAFLRARLLDLMIGDWDRHYGQFRWARMPDSDFLQPIPEDRDQAFSVYDGMAIDVIRILGAQFTEFKPKHASIERMIRDGADHDRFILNDIERDEWLAIADEVAAALNDDVFRAAIDRLPPEYTEQVAEVLFERLTARRATLREAADDFYEILNRRVDVHGTDQPELFTVERLAGGEVEVRVAVAGESEPYYARRFRPGETKDIRIYLYGGADRVSVTGEANRKIRVRAVAGDPEDRVDDQLGGRGVQRFDFADQEIGVPAGRRADVDPGALFTSPDIRLPGAPTKDWGTQQLPLMVIGYHTDPGFVLGFGTNLRSYRFRKPPWGHRHLISGGIATGPEGGFFEYDGDYRRRKGVWNGELLLRISDLEQLRFYGLGNETPVRRPDLTTRADVRRVTLYPALARDIGKHGTLSLGPLFHYTDSSNSVDTSVLGSERPYGFGTFAETGFQVEYDFDSRETVKVLQPGLQGRASAAWFPDGGDVETSYGYIDAAIGWHKDLGESALLSIYGGGKHIWSDFPFYQAAYLGGQSNAGGYRWNRFAGDASVYTSTQLRWAFKELKAFIPGEVGLTVKGEVGRVFLDDESSSRWYPTGGLAFFFSPFQRKLLFELGVDEGQEDTLWIFNGGVRFGGLE